MLLRKVVSACQRNSGLENEFVIAKVVPVEISPYEKLPVIVIVLERRLTLEDKVKKNYDYSSLAVKAFLEGGNQFEDYFVPAYDPDEELPKQDSKKHDSTECISSSNMNDNEVSVVYESSTEPVIYESSVELQSSDNLNNDEVTVVYEGSTGCTSSNNETNDDVTVVYENTDENNKPQNVNLYIEPKKLIIEMLQNGGPHSTEEYEVQLKLKEENLALDIQIFTQIMKTIVPNVMKKRNPGYLFQMDDLRRSSFVKSLCDRLFVQSTTLKIRDPSLYSSKPKQRETCLIYGLTSDSQDTPLSVPLTEIHSHITRNVYEKIQKVIEEFGQPLYDSVNNFGFWRTFLIRVNSLGQALLQMIVKVSGGVEDAVAISSELEPLLKKHFQNNEEGKYNLETLILDIVHKRGTVNQVVFGEGYLSEVVGDFNLKLYEDFLWCDINGIQNLCESIVNLVNVDSSWAVVQLGRGYIVPAFYLAKQCGKYFLFCKNSKTCRNILDVAEENGITNIDCKCYGAAVKNVKQTFCSNLTSFKNICVLIMHDFNTCDDYAAVKFLKNIPAIKHITYIPKHITNNMKEIAVLCAEDSEHPGPFVIKDVVSVDISPRDNNVKTMLLLMRKSLVKSLIEKNKELCPELFPKLLLMLKENKRKMVKRTIISEMEKIISEKRSDCDEITRKRNEDIKSNPSRPVCSAAVQQLWTESRHESDECQEVRRVMEKLFSHSDPKFYVDYTKMYELKKKLLQVRMTSLSKKLDLFLPTLVCNRSPNFVFFLSELKRCPAIATMCERTYVNLESSPSHMEEVFELSRPCRTTSAKVTCERVKSFVNKQYINPANSEEKVYWKNAVIRTNWNGKVWLMIECTVFTESVGKHTGTLIPLLKTHFTGKEAESCNIATLILKINAVNESATEVVLGDELMDDVIENFKVKVHGRNMTSSNPYAIKILCDTIVKLAEIDKTWAILQLNSDTGIETLRLAKLCSVLYLSEIPQQSAVNLLVLDNKVNNAVFLPVPMESEFRDVVNNKLGTCENICVIYHLKNYDCTVSSVLRNNPNIKKIIFVSDIHYAYWAPNIVSCCLKQSGFSEPFVIKNVVPIDMSPSDDKIKIVFLLMRESLVNALVKTNPCYSQEKVTEYLNEINFEESNMVPDNCEVSFTSGKSNKNDNARDNHRSTVKNERNRKDRKRHSRDRSRSDIRGYGRTDYSRTRESSFKRYNPEPILPRDSRRDVDSQSKHQSTKRTRSPTFGRDYERDKKIQKRNDGKNDLWFPVHEFTKKSTEQNFNKNISPWIGAQQVGGLLSQLAPKSNDVISAQSLLQNTLRNEILEQVSRLNALSQIPLTDIVDKSTKSDLFGIPPLKDSLEMSGRYNLLQSAQDNTKQTTMNSLFSRDIIKETTQQNYGLNSSREVMHLSSSRESVRENLLTTGRESGRETVQQNYGVESYRGATHSSTTREPIRENLSTGRESMRETVQQNYGTGSYRGATHPNTTREPVRENLSTGRESMRETVHQNYGTGSYRGATHPNTTREPIRENLSTGRESMRETVQRNFSRESFIGLPRFSSSIDHIREDLSIGIKPAQQSYHKSYRGITNATSSLPLRENLNIGREPIREIAQQSYNKSYGGITHSSSSLPLRENLSIGREPIREIAQQGFREELNSGIVQHNSREELIREIAQQSYRLSLLQEALKNDLSQSSSGNVQSRPLVETLGINVPHLPASVSTQQLTQNYGLFENRMRDPASYEQNLSHSSNLLKRK